jgi:iron complex transport system ATP-binding protein
MVVPPVPLELAGVDLVVDGSTLLRGVDWRVAPDERWVVLGANGSGKTTLLRVASLYAHPSRGTVRVLGGELGRIDVRTWRRRIGLASPAFGALLRPQLTAVEVVMTAREAALEPWWHEYDDTDRERALRLLQRFGVAHGADRGVATLSSGERQRVLLARAFAGEPGIVLLDEPTAGLDLGGREELVGALGVRPGDPPGPPTVLVTHHVEELPVGTTHVLLLRAGEVLSAGPLDEVLTADALSEAFGLPLELERRGDRFAAWGRDLSR